MLHTHKVMSDDEILAMQERNNKRAVILTRKLGERYACHESKRVERKTKPCIGTLSHFIVRMSRLPMMKRQAG